MSAMISQDCSNDITRLYYHKVCGNTTKQCMSPVMHTDGREVEATSTIITSPKRLQGQMGARQSDAKLDFNTPAKLIGQEYSNIQL